MQREDLDPIHGRIGDLMKHMEELKHTLCRTMKEKDEANAKLSDEKVENIKQINEKENQLQVERQNISELKEQLKKSENRATSTPTQVKSEVLEQRDTDIHKLQQQLAKANTENDNLKAKIEKLKNDLKHGNVNVMAAGPAPIEEVRGIVNRRGPIWPSGTVTPP